LLSLRPPPAVCRTGRVGDPVAAGDVIGSVGDTGGHEQPALYFEVRRGREPVNPENWLQRR